jgi:hypothetical protein
MITGDPALDPLDLAQNPAVVIKLEALKRGRGADDLNLSD